MVGEVKKTPFFTSPTFYWLPPQKKIIFWSIIFYHQKSFFLLPLPWGRSEKKVRGEKNFLYFPYLEIIIIFLVREVKFFFFTLSKKNFVYRRKWNIFHSCEKINFFYFPYLKIIIIFCGRSEKKNLFFHFYHYFLLPPTKKDFLVDPLSSPKKVFFTYST